jgi:hypothetical protein
MPHLPNRAFARGMNMKNKKATRGFWSWLLGSGWSNGGGTG